jgi:GTP cyclohydrolase I
MQRRFSKANATKTTGGSMNTPISTIIRNRATAAGVKFFANDNISPFIEEGELELLQEELSGKFAGVLESMIIDVDNDHNSKDTANRLAKMYLTEAYKGRYSPMPRMVEFPNYMNLDEMFVVGPITVRSACSHHHVPIIGDTWIGVVPGKNVKGLSKFNRLVDWVMRRPQIQEEAIVRLADLLESQMEPKGLGVLMKATHFCVKWRGVEDRSLMTNAVLRGCIKEQQATRAEFYNMCRMNGCDINMI